MPNNEQEFAEYIFDSIANDKATLQLVYNAKGTNAAVLQGVLDKIGMRKRDFLKRCIDNEMERLGVRDWIPQ